LLFGQKRNKASSIENKYPHITYNGCTAHGIDLVLEDIGKIDWVHKIVNEARTNILYIITNMVCVYLSVRLLLIFYLFLFL
jgi:hypothetical protein